MSMMEKISQDLKLAMKDRDENRVAALRMIRTAVTMKEKEKGAGTAGDDDVIAIVQSMARRYEDSIEQFRKGGREDLATAEEAQLKVVLSYLPEKVSDDEIRASVAKAVGLTGAASKRDFGRVMGPVMKDLKETGKLVDGNDVKRIVGDVLAGIESDAK
jgi:hypothetical protein